MKTLRKSFISFCALLSLLCLTPACAWFGKRFAPADKGGMYLILNVKSDSAQLDQTVAQTMAVIEKRCDLLAIRCTSERLGGQHANQIKIRIPTSVDPERTKRILLAQGEELEMRAVVSPSSPAPLRTYRTQEEAAAVAGTDKDILPYMESNADNQGSDKRFVIVERTPIVTGQDIRDAEAMRGASGAENNYQINFRLNPEGADRFGRWTGANINNYLAVVLNKQVRSVAYIRSQIFDSGQINGKFTKQQAEDIAMLLMSGSFPAPVEAVEEGTY